jgi:hypothetical protein
MSNGWGQNTWGTSDFGWGGVATVSIEVTSVFASGNVGSVVIKQTATVTVSREATQGGWGRSSWGDGAWNEATQLPDISMVGAVGSTFVNADANVTGLSGVSGLKFLGEEEVRTNNNISVTGFGLTATVSDVDQRLVNRVNVTGVSANTRLNNVDVIGDANVSITGFSMTANLGNELVWGEINTNQTPNWQIIKEAA